MKAIFLALAIIVSGIGAYFSYSEGSKINELIGRRTSAVDETDTVSAKVSKAQKEIEAQKQQITELNVKKEEITQSISALRSSGTSLKRELSGLDTEIQAQEAEMADLSKSIEELNGLVKSLGSDITIDNLASKIQEMQDSKRTKEAKLEETKTLAEAAAKTAAESRAEKDRLIKRKLEHTVAIRNNASESVITAVNPEWGFVVVGAGSNSGYKPQTALLVERDGKYIGKIIVSSVEPTQTIAEIDAATLATGVRFQPGDRVILGKTSN